MGMNLGNNNENVTTPSCPRSYKPWVWTLLVMAILTLGWTIIESYREGGMVRSLFDVNEIKGHISESASDIHNLSPTSRSALIVAPQATQLQTSYHSIIEVVRPAVVSIDASVTAPQQQGMTAPDIGAAVDPSLIAATPIINYTRVGSGVIIDPRGYILSSLHVVMQADSLKATVYSDAGAKEYPVKIVNADKTTDLALLLIQSDGLVQFPHADLGDSNLTRTGDIVLALGSPFGFDQTVTTGIISSRNRTLKIGNDIYSGMLQTDTPINRGNSGGPLVNAKGEVIGINTAIYSPNGVFSGIGFAVPVSKAETLVAGLLDFQNTPTQVATGQIVAWANRGRQMGNTFKLPNGQVLMPPHTFRGRCIECHPQLCTAQNGNIVLGPGIMQQGLGNGQGNGVGNGQVGQGAPVAFGQFGQTAPMKPFLGAILVDVDPILADKFGLLHPSGVLVDRVYRTTPADTAGILRGDIIMRVDGKRVMNVAEVQQMLDTKKIGAKFNFAIFRKGQRVEATVATVNQPLFMPQLPATAPGVKTIAEYDWLGTEFTPLIPAVKGFVDKGVYVADVGGVLAMSGLAVGDVVVELDGKPVNDITSFVALSKNVSPRVGFLLDVVRAGEPLYITVKR